LYANIKQTTMYIETINKTVQKYGTQIIQHSIQNKETNVKRIN